MRNLMTNHTVLFWHFIALFWLLIALYITLSMGRAPCCEKVGIKKGPWTSEEDHRLREYITRYGDGCWRTLPKKAGLFRCGKSCRLRWINYLQPNLKRGNITEEEDRIIIESHAAMGNRWSMIASKLPGRTDNEIKNYWNTHLKKKLSNMGLDPQTHQPRHNASTSSTSIPKFTIQTASTSSNYIPEMIKRGAGSVKGNHSNSKEDLCCREQLISSSYHFNEAYNFPPSSIRSNMSVITNSWSISDIRDRRINMSPVQPSPYDDFNEACKFITYNSISNNSVISNYSSTSDIRDKGKTIAPMKREPSPYDDFNEACKFTTYNSISNNSVISNYSSTSDIRDKGKNIAPVKPELAPESQANSITDLDRHEILMYSNLFKSSVIAHCSSTSDTRGINIAHMKVEPDLEPPANSIANLVPGWSGLYSLDTVNHCPAAVSSTKDQEVRCNTIATNTANSMSADNDPSTMNVPAFSNISSPNHQLNPVDGGLFFSSPVINMDQQHSNVEEYLQVDKELEAAVQWAFNDPISLDLLR